MEVCMLLLVANRRGIHQEKPNMPVKSTAAARERDLLNREAAARRICVSVRTLDTLVAAGRIPVIRVSPRRVAFDPADLDRYVARHRR